MGDVLNVIDKATTPAAGEDAKNWSGPIRLVIVFTALALLPSLLVMMTSFTRIVIVLSFVRRALTTQTIPPNIAIIGLALFLTLFTMAPTFALINRDAVQPYLQNKMEMNAAGTAAADHMKDFMLRQTRASDCFSNCVTLPLSAGVQSPERPTLSNAERVERPAA